MAEGAPLRASVWRCDVSPRVLRWTVSADDNGRVGMVSNREQVERVELTYEELREQHQTHERRLEELNNKAWLTPEEEMEAKRLKKLKLHLKDQMARLRQAAS